MHNVIKHISTVKVAVNRKLQKFMHGLFILVLYIEVYAVILATLYCRASLVQLSQQISYRYCVPTQGYSAK